MIRNYYLSYFRFPKTPEFFTKFGNRIRINVYLPLRSGILLCQPNRQADSQQGEVPLTPHRYSTNKEKMAKKEAIHYLNNFQLQLLILFVQFSTIITICFFCAFLKKLLLIPDQVHPSAYLMSFQTEY